VREVYLDNAATMTKIPEAIKVEAEFYELVNANPLRGLYKKSVQAETEVEVCRKKLLKLARADESYTVIFTRGTTEALNLVAGGLLRGSDGFGVVSKNSRVVVDIESHHSNILPFKQRYKNVIIAKKMDARELFAAEVISLTGVSNVTGKDFTKRIKKVRKMCPKAILGVDMAQMLCHTSVDLKDSTIYVDLFPCNECAKAIIQAGIKEVVYMSDEDETKTSYKTAMIMFKETNVKLRKLEKTEFIENLMKLN